MTIQPGFSVSRRKLQQKAPNLALSKRDDSSPHHLPNGGSARCRHSERGTVTAMVAIFAVAVVASVLLLFDASRRLNAMTSAQDLASETARYAAAFIDEDSVWSGTASISDEAESEAIAFAQAAGASEVVIEVAADGQSVIATITIDGGTPLIPGFDLEGTGQHRALVITS